MDTDTRILLEALLALYEKYAASFDVAAREHLDEYYQGKADAYSKVAEQLKYLLQEDK